MTPILAAAFGTFMLFVALGLGALAVTAVLDRALGKERALLLYALGLLALTAFVLKPAPASGAAGRGKSEKVLAPFLTPRVVAPDLIGRPSFLGASGSTRRNAFERTTDTRPLPPIVLEIPPSLAMEFPLPPPIPGPAPAWRRLLRGTAPTLPEEEASTVLEVPAITFSEYQVRPEDVYDWYDLGTGGKVYSSIVAINGVRSGTPTFPALQRQLASGEDLDKLQVEFAHIGLEKEASKNLSPDQVARRSKQNRQTDKASDPKFAGWHLRRSVENEYQDALRAYLPGEKLETTQQVSGLKNAAEAMAKVGRTGKEGGEGWRRAALLLERALAVARQNLAAAEQAEILVGLVEAYRGLGDETSVLRVLTEYAAAAPNSAKPWVWLGQLTLEKMHLPEEALAYFAKARSLEGGNEEAALGEGDAHTRLGRHPEALAAYKRAGASFAAHVRRAEAALRVGDLGAATTSSDAALGLQPDAPRALLVRGAVLYTKGADLQAAKSAFAVAAMSTAEAGVWRAQSLYDLGLTCWRLGETRAAIGAFDACDAALRMGAAPSRSPDETVSPFLGRALVAFALKAVEPDPNAAPPANPPAPLSVRRESLGEYLASARDEARRSAYLEHFAGVLASGQENVPAAIRALRRSLLLAPDSTELDGWLAVNHLRWAFTRAIRPESAGTGVSRDREERRLEAILAQKAEEHFEAAVAFAARASQGDVAADPKSYLALLRETWVRLQAEHLSPRKRFEAALATVNRVLDRPDEQREHPAALALRAYAFYRLGGEENYKNSLRDFGIVLEKVEADKPDAPWAEWRAYASRMHVRVVHWLSLEEKVISFEGLTQLPKEWLTHEKGGGVQVLLEPTGLIWFTKSAERAGTIQEPIVAVVNQTLFEKGTFEELTIRARIPLSENNVTFGVGVQGTTATSGTNPGGVPARHPGISIFYDKGKIAARVGTGIHPTWKDGEVKRVRDEAGAEKPWPPGEWVTIRIALEDRAKGLMSVYLNDDEEPVISDKVGGFKASTGKAELWLGGWSAHSMLFDVKIKDIRIVRVKRK